MTDQVLRPTLARRRLSRMLRRLRNEAGKTHADVTAARLGSRSKMSAIESGRVPVGADTVYGLSALYRVPTEVTDLLLALAAATKRTDGRRHPLDPSIPEHWRTYADLVDSAAALQIHSVELIHPLLQTEDYTRAVIAADPALTPDARERRVSFHRQRQQAFLGRPSPGRLAAVVTAGALGVVVGSPDVTAHQIAHLRALDAGHQASVRVLPATHGLHAAMRGGGFMLMQFDDPHDPPLVHIENLTDTEYLERDDQVAAYRRVFDAITAQAVALRDHP